MSDLANHLREHADRVAGGGTGEPEYDPETLVLEHDAADRIEALEAEVERLRAKAVERERVWAEHVARREFASADNERATVKWAKRNAHELEAEVERLTAIVRAADAMREGIRQAGVKREPGLYEAVMVYDAALAGEGNEDE